MALKNLPIGLSNLEKIINNNCIYVDKTRFVVDLVNSGGYYFFSRPRRFGKTLFLDTLKQAFLGNKDLFKGLYIENNWDWNVKYPVIHISFASSETHDITLLLKNMHNTLDRNIKHYELDEILAEELLNNKFMRLIEALYTKYNSPVVILIDEYDKPILDNITNLDNAHYARDLLKSLYAVIKDCDQYLKFVFFTGVTKFAKAGVFSSLNNLNDITFHHQYVDICGYTQNDIETIFKDYLLDVNLAELKTWYNGYNFLGTENQKVYNPFDILLFISNGNIYKNYWFETGTPTFLIKLLQKKNYYLPRLENVQIGDDELASFDINNLAIEVLLLQSGYLTIKDTQINNFDKTISYILSYPNFEVRKSLNSSVISHLFAQNIIPVSQSKYQMGDALQNNDFAQMKTILASLLSSIPHDWFRNNNIQYYEGFYCSIVYTFFNAVGIFAIPEDSTSMGQIDLTLHLPNIIMIVEFKMLSNDNATNALQQIKDKRYHEKYLVQNKPIYLIGMVFDKENRNLCEFAWEEVVR